MWKYLAIFALILGLAIYIARQDERAAQERAQNATHLGNSAIPAKTNEEHPQENIGDTERHAPGWYSFFRWPNGTTTWAIVLTLLAIAEQTSETAKAARATRDSVGHIERQAGIMDGQLTEIKLAGEQTKRLVEQAEKSATAAKESADAIVNSERAWIMADLRFRADVLKDTKMRASYTANGRSMDVFLICKNDGRTPAWITERVICFRNFTILPEHPDFAAQSGPEFICSVLEPVSVGGEHRTGWTLDYEGAIAAGDTLVTYGVVRYRDIFGNNRETRFGYTLQGNCLQRFASADKFWEYNSYT